MAIGRAALGKNTTGFENVAVGDSALNANTTGDDNTAVGVDALKSNTSGSSNTIIGQSALSANTIGERNTVIGLGAGESNITGSGNVIIGYQAGAKELGSNKLYISNSNTESPLIGGDFSSNQVDINGTLNVSGSITADQYLDKDGNLLHLSEDVGRHNAMDKLIGNALMNNKIPINDEIVIVSGRCSFELIQKSLRAGFPIILALGAPTSLAVDIAMEHGMTLACFVKENKITVFSGSRRIRHHQ